MTSKDPKLMPRVLVIRWGYEITEDLVDMSNREIYSIELYLPLSRRMPLLSIIRIVSLYSTVQMDTLQSLEQAAKRPISR